MIITTKPTTHIRREPTPLLEDTTWSGTGFMKVYEGSTLTFDVPEMSSNGNYDLVQHFQFEIIPIIEFIMKAWIFYILWNSLEEGNSKEGICFILQILSPDSVLRILSIISQIFRFKIKWARLFVLFGFVFYDLLSSKTHNEFDHRSNFSTLTIPKLFFKVIRYEHTPNFPNEWTSGTVEVNKTHSDKSGEKCNGDDVRMVHSC